VQQLLRRVRTSICSRLDLGTGERAEGSAERPKSLMIIPFKQCGGLQIRRRVRVGFLTIKIPRPIFKFKRNTLGIQDVRVP